MDSRYCTFVVRNVSTGRWLGRSGFVKTLKSAKRFYDPESARKACNHYSTRRADLNPGFARLCIILSIEEAEKL